MVKLYETNCELDLGEVKDSAGMRDPAEGLRQRSAHVAYPSRTNQQYVVDPPNPLREVPPRLFAVIIMVAMCITAVFWPAYMVKIRDASCSFFSSTLR
jgi:hypothetical protein